MHKLAVSWMAVALAENTNFNAYVKQETEKKEANIFYQFV